MLVQFRPPFFQAKTPSDQGPPVGLGRGSMQDDAGQRIQVQQHPPAWDRKVFIVGGPASFRATGAHSSAWARLLSSREPVRVVFSVGGWARATMILPVSQEMPTWGLGMGLGPGGERGGEMVSEWLGCSEGRRSAVLSRLTVAGLPFFCDVGHLATGL